MRANNKPGKDYIGVGVFTLIFNNNEFLLAQSLSSLKKSKEYEDIWSMLGGTVEFGETCKDALIREIKEETGLDIFNIKLINYNDYIKEGKHWISLNFRAETNNQEVSNLEPDKNKSFQWFDINNIPENISPYTKECLNLIRAHSSAG